MDKPGSPGKIKVRIHHRAKRLANLIELNAPNIILIIEMGKLQDQIVKWHKAVINQLLQQNHDLRVKEVCELT